MGRTGAQSYDCSRLHVSVKRVRSNKCPEAEYGEYR